jgi:hypothetical protein
MAKDIIHDAVKSALIKDGWTITADPYYLKYEELSFLLIWLLNVPRLQRKKMGKK